MTLTTASGRPITRVRPGTYTTEYDPYAHRGDIIERSFDGKAWIVFPRFCRAPHQRFRTLAEASKALV